jgi:hypothetical protein
MPLRDEIRAKTWSGTANMSPLLNRPQQLRCPQRIRAKRHAATTRRLHAVHSTIAASTPISGPRSGPRHQDGQRLRADTRGIHYAALPAHYIGRA